MQFTSEISTKIGEFGLIITKSKGQNSSNNNRNKVLQMPFSMLKIDGNQYIRTVYHEKGKMITKLHIIIRMSEVRGIRILPRHV
jgi:hypothetical protein